MFCIGHFDCSFFVYFPYEIAFPESKHLKEYNFTKDHIFQIHYPSIVSLKFNFFDLLQIFFWVYWGEETNSLVVSDSVTEVTESNPSGRKRKRRRTQGCVQDQHHAAVRLTLEHWTCAFLCTAHAALTCPITVWRLSPLSPRRHCWARAPTFILQWKGTPVPAIYFILRVNKSIPNQLIFTDHTVIVSHRLSLFASGSVLLIICYIDLISHNSPLFICCCYCSFLLLKRFSHPVKRQKQHQLLKEPNNQSVHRLHNGTQREQPGSCLLFEYHSPERLGQHAEKAVIHRERGRWRTQRGISKWIFLY